MEEKKSKIVEGLKKISTKKRLLKKKNSTKDKNQNNKENELLSSMPQKLQIIHQFTKSYNVDKKYTEEQIGLKRSFSEHDDQLSAIDERLNKFFNI